jgi:ABC-type molybdate transport system substrate-binding protein
MATDFLSWKAKETFTDDELILSCLNNAPCGSDKKQIMKLIKKYEELTNGV